MQPVAPAPGTTRGAALVLLAAGNGKRVGHAVNKVFLPLAGRPVCGWSLLAAGHVTEIVQTLLVVRESDRALAQVMLDQEAGGRNVRMVTGAGTRHGSESAALADLEADIEAGTVDVVVIHDAARPLAGAALFRQVIAGARANGGAFPARPQRNLLSVDTSESMPPAEMVAAQTPQAFLAKPLLDAYAAASAEGFVGSDTAGCFERFADLDVVCLPGEASNIKITFVDDLLIAERLLTRPAHRG